MQERSAPDPPAGGESPEEVAARRRGDPYLVYADNWGRRRVVSLPGAWDRASVGRSLDADIVLGWDEKVSAVHSWLERLGDDWLLVDDGLSRNGSYVNRERVTRRRLRDGDELLFGSTTLVFHAPFQQGRQSTVVQEVPQELRRD